MTCCFFKICKTVFPNDNCFCENFKIDEWSDLMKTATLEELEKTKRDFLTVKEVSAGMGISRHLFYKVADRVPFPVLKIGRAYKIPKQPFITYLKTGEAVKSESLEKNEKTSPEGEVKNKGQ